MMRGGVDLISIAGLLLAGAAIVGGQILEGGHIGSLIQVTAFFIVIGGTMGAVMLQSSLPVFLNGMRLLKWVFVPPQAHPAQVIEEILGWSQIARNGGLLALEPLIDDLSDPFKRKGLQMLVDGAREKVEQFLGQRAPRQERFGTHRLVFIEPNIQDRMRPIRDGRDDDVDARGLTSTGVSTVCE